MGRSLILLSASQNSVSSFSSESQLRQAFDFLSIVLMTAPLAKLKFTWEGSDNPSDPSGVAHFSISDVGSVAVGMNNCAQALKLNSLIEKACQRAKQDELDRVYFGIFDFLNRTSHD